MKISASGCKNTESCNKLLLKLQTIEEKCDKIIDGLSFLEELISSPSDMDGLILSMKRCADELLEQSIEYRKSVANNTGSSFMRVERR